MLGPDHPHTLTTRNNLTIALQKRATPRTRHPDVAAGAFAEGGILNPSATAQRP
jgi:hypothetical protein